MLVVNALYSQTDATDNRSITLPSVNNNVFSSAKNNNVNLYSGKVAPTVPVLTLKSRQFEIPATLNYVAGSGIKVQDVASQVGLGWQLQCGGMITRMVRGVPDETQNGYIGTNHVGQTINNTNPTTDDIRKNIGTGVWDGEPDLFTIITPSFEYKFIIDEYGNVVFTNSTGLKIVHNLYNGNGENTFFTVTDDKGNKYTFGQNASARESVQTQFGNQTRSSVSTWFLEKIEDVNHTDVVSFFYLTGSNYSYTYYRSSHASITTSGQCTTNPEVDYNLNVVYTVLSPKYLGWISTENESLVASYAYDRQDVPNAARLSALNLQRRDNSNVLKIVDIVSFQYSYFNPAGGTDVKRLKLDSIRHTGSDHGAVSLLTTSFGYNTSVNLPARNSVEVDYFGYYNHNSSGTMLVPDANKEPDLQRTKANVLTSITNPSGGSSLFEYELNKYYDTEEAQDKVICGLRIKEIKETDNITVTSQVFEYLDGNGHSSGQIHDKLYKRFTRKAIWGTAQTGIYCMLNANVTISESIFNSFDLNGVFVGYSNVKIIDPDGGSTISEFTNFDQFPDSYEFYSSDNDNTALSDIQVALPTSYMYKRGLLKRKSMYNSQGSIVADETYQYSTVKALTTKCLSLSLVATRMVLTAFGWHVGTYKFATENYCATGKISRIYDPMNSNVYNETIESYSYSNGDNRLINEIKRTDSKGIEYSKRFTYVNSAFVQINGFTAKQFMLDANITATPAIIEEYRMNEKLSTSFNTYTTMNNASNQQMLILGDVKSSFHSSPLEIQQSYFYDGYTNLIKASSMNKSLSSHRLYDENKRRVIAEIESETDDFAYTSFEYQNEKGNWSFNNNSFNATYDVPNLEYANAISGKRIYNLYYSNVSKQNLNASKSYSLTVWFRGGAPSVTVNGTFSSKIVKERGEWQLFKVEIRNSTSVALSSVSDSYIDELRLYALPGSMKTYVYDNLKGIISFFDENSVFERYEYDGFNRLTITWDDKGNIVRRNCYNLSSISTPCKEYRSVEQSGVFYSSKCPQGYMGTAYTYVVPAGKFTGVTQGAADYRAYQYLYDNGQKYADLNGGCIEQPLEMLVEFEGGGGWPVEYISVADAPVPGDCILMMNEPTGFLISTNLTLNPTTTYVAEYWEYECEGEFISYDYDSPSINILSNWIIDYHGNWKKHQVIFNNISGTLAVLFYNSNMYYFQDFKLRQQ